MTKKREFFLWQVSSDKVRLLSFLKDKIKNNCSNKVIKKALEQGFCQVNGKIERFSSVLLHKNDRVLLDKNYLKTADEQAKKEFTVLYEDDDLLVCNKPYGVICFEENIRRYFPNSFLVHRLDKQTSGAIILAKSKKIKDLFIQQFKEKKVKKIYVALVDGKVKYNKKEIKSYLYPKVKYQGQTLYASSKNKQGVFAHSIVEKMFSKDTYSKVSVEIITGRTHQIRVHLKEDSHPVLGDYQYSKSFKYPYHVSRIMLHSYKVEFNHPVTGKLIKVTAPLCSSFKGVM